MDENEIRWKVTDPLGNEIVLKNITFRRHIQGDHGDKDAASALPSKTKCNTL